MKARLMTFTVILISLIVNGQVTTHNGHIWNFDGPNAGAWDLVDDVERFMADNSSVKDMLNQGIAQNAYGFQFGWEAANTTLFVQINESDYTSINVSTTLYEIENLFSAGTPYSEIDSTHVGASYIAKLRGGNEYAAIRISNILPTQSDNLDKIEFEYKKDFPDCPPLILYVNDTTICYGSILFLNTYCDSNSAYSWYPSDFLSDSSICNPDASPATTTTYTVILEHTGCLTLSDSVTISVNYVPQAGFIYNTSGSVATFQDTSLFASGVEWNFGDPASGALNTSTVSSPTHIYNTPGTHIVTLIVSNECGSDTISQQISVNTGVKEINKTTIKVFPNPFNTYLCFEDESPKSQNYKIDIYDLYGKRVLQKTMSGKTTVNTEFLSPGIYLVRIYNFSKNLLYFEKLIKQ